MSTPHAACKGTGRVTFWLGTGPCSCAPLPITVRPGRSETSRELDVMAEAGASEPLQISTWRRSTGAHVAHAISRGLRHTGHGDTRLAALAALDRSVAGAM